MRRTLAAFAAIIAAGSLAACGSTPPTAATTPSPSATPSESASACSPTAMTCGGPSATPPPAKATHLLPGALATFTELPAATFNAIGRGTAIPDYDPQPIDTAALTQDGKPRVLYVGAEWCPYCAGERWALALALGRFGTFTDLGQVRSAKNDGNVASISFHGSTYTSDYLALGSFEVEDRDYQPLDLLSPADGELFKTVGQSGYPFIDLGGKYMVNASYDISVLLGLNQAQIVGALKDPRSPVTQAVVGAANVLTARLCELTHDQPAAVCTAAAVTSLR